MLSGNILPHQQQQNLQALSRKKDTIVEFGFKTLFYQAFEDISEESVPLEGGGMKKWQKRRGKRQDHILEGRMEMEQEPRIHMEQEEEEGREGWREEEGRGLWKKKKKKKKGEFLLLSNRLVGLRVGNASLKRLLSGAFSGAVSRTAVAPLETIRTHLMVGSCGRTFPDVFHHIMHTEGWTGLFRAMVSMSFGSPPAKLLRLVSNIVLLKLFILPMPRLSESDIRLLYIFLSRLLHGMK